MIFAAEGLRAVAAVPSSPKTIPKDPDICGSVTRNVLNCVCVKFFAIKCLYLVLNYAIMHGRF